MRDGLPAMLVATFQRQEKRYSLQSAQESLWEEKRYPNVGGSYLRGRDGFVGQRTVQIRTDTYRCLTRAFQDKQSSVPSLGAGGLAPFTDGLWAGRGTETVLPARKGLQIVLAWVLSPRLTHLQARGQSELHSSTSHLVCLADQGPRLFSEPLVSLRERAAATVELL